MDHKLIDQALNTKVLFGYGASSEEVLRSLRDNAHDLCKPEAE